MGSAYTYANIYGKTGNLYLRANSYPANTGSNGIIYLQTANSSGGQAADVVVNNGNLGLGYGSPDYTLKVAGDCYVRDATTLDGTVSVGGTYDGLIHIKDDAGNNTIQIPSNTYILQKFFQY